MINLNSDTKLFFVLKKNFKMLSILYMSLNNWAEIFLQFIEEDKTIEDDFYSKKDLLLKEDIWHIKHTSINL